MPPHDGISLTPMEANGGTSLSAELTTITQARVVVANNSLGCNYGLCQRR